MKRRTRVLSGVFTLALLSAFPSMAGTWYVRQGGNDTADGKTSATAFRTVLRAAGVLNHGDSLVIGPGAYKESVLLAERFSADGAVMTVTGDESGKLTGDAAGAVVMTSAKPTEMALTFLRFRNLRISGLTFRGPGQGLKLDKCLSAAVERCTFDGLTRGLVASNCANVTVQSCVLARNTIGLFVQASSGVKVDHVTLAGSTSVGLLALSCGPGEIRNSILAANNANLIIDPISAKSWSCDCNVINGTTGDWGDVPPVAKIYEWTAASGQDRHSVYVVPAFVDPDKYDLHIAPEVTWPGGLPGMSVGQAAPPAQPLDRDGKAFRARDGATGAGAYDYPDPQLANGWTRLAAKIDGKGPRQSAGVYKDTGELVRTLLADAAGVTQLYWDGLDDQGQPAPAGKYVAKILTHDVRVVDDGAFGDNGNPMGAYNCDNAYRVCPLSDGGFMMATLYDEGMFPLRRYSASGQPTRASGVASTVGDFSALVSTDDDDMYSVMGKGEATKLVRLEVPGELARMRDGSESYRVLDAAEKDATVLGLAVAGKTAYLSLGGLNVVRLIDLATGKKKADWPVANVADIAADAKGTLWVITGKEVAALTADGKIDRYFASSLETPRYLAAGKDRLAVIDNAAAKVAVLDMAGKVVRAMGKDRPVGEFVPVGPDYMRDPRGACFLTDGRLVVTEGNRVRIFFADEGKISQSLVSDFMDQAVVHPTQPAYVITSLGIFHVDPKTGAWDWLVEEPRGMTVTDAEGKVKPVSFGAPSTGVMLGGRPFVAYVYGDTRMRLVDVSDPLKPRPAVMFTNNFCGWHAYMTVGFGRDGSLISIKSGTEKNPSPPWYNRVPFKGLDDKNNPVFDFDNAKVVGLAADPDTVRGMVNISTVATDKATDDVYIGAKTALYNKMVPAWGADATGVGKISPDGRPMWFALSSGGNYMSIDSASDGKNSFLLAGKSFGGQIDLFDPDGLRYTTGNWSWPCNYGIGFVDMRYGVNAYLRPDGKIGAYVEDDGIGRLARVRVDGADTIRKTSAAFDWQATGTAAGAAADASVVRGKGLEKVQVIPRVAELKVDGDWAAWVKAGVVPQIMSLPTVSYRHTIMPEDLWQTFSMGTAIGALAHDGKNLYAYFVVTDEPQRFDVDNPGLMFCTDSVELWMEEDQFGLGLIRDGSAHLFKYRYHDRAGKEWSANYPLANENVWAVKLDDISSHPLGRQLADITGVSLKGRKGYAVMGKIPMEEVKLVGGIAGRSGKDVLNMTGNAGEVVRIAVAFSGITAWGHAQDYKVCWPSSMMFSDPTRSAPFVLGK